tara:strand:- start:3210 stop:3839 length:630 start_codon:yes stop_codon:yes gene_type:complete
MTNKILVVEDNLKYAVAAQKYLESRNLEIACAKDYDDAVNKLTNFLPNSLIVDCFFPKLTGSKDLSLGYEAVQKMLNSDPEGRKNTPTTKALRKVGNLLGRDFAKFAAKNAHANYSSEVDNYWSIEQAIKENESNQPLGILIAEKAEKLGLPFVLATSTFHHDELTQPIQDYASRKGWTLIDCNPNKEDEKATLGFWERVYSSLEGKLK